MALAGLNTNIAVTGASTAMSAEACSVIANTNNEDWEIDDGAKDVWDWATTLTVTVDDSSTGTSPTLGSGEFTARWLIGVVQIDNYTSGSGNVANITGVRVDGAYLPQHTVLEGRSGGFSVENDLLDITQLGDTAQRRMLGIKDVTPSFEQLKVTETPIDGVGGTESSIEDYAQNATDFVYTFNEGAATKSKQRAVVKVGGLDLESPQDDIQTESLEVSINTEPSTMSDQPSADWDIWDY